MPVDEVITQTPVVKITGRLDTNIICGMCSVETYRLIGEPQLYIAETGEPVCSFCADEYSPAFNILLSLFIAAREYFGEPSGVFDDAASFMEAFEKLRPLMERHFKRSKEAYAITGESDLDEGEDVAGSAGRAFDTI